MRPFASFASLVADFPVLSPRSSNLLEFSFMQTLRRLIWVSMLLAVVASPVFTQTSARLEQLKKEATADVDKMKDLSQQMVDQVFSYGELGFQEFETSRYLVDVLKKNGFQVKEGISGIPTAWIATWGSGKPVIALGSDIDGIPKASQKPGVAYHDPIIEGAPGP